ncbi:flagellar basal body P-ring formation chaperone FlgA [Adhaeretor mobilis]|uniref:Flagellar basal body P-ring biosynthesis protein FlgA n=1 Tax=Adhaeretor mobilis TaxID=1930276 RepID=A0A517MTV4_9BACT|nr:flagellar basal body P-ring formation chaperone FlgA [Adhaeretor mobilis]QDS98316.1 flagellar basal body P-ring biosynthesis protein FlgA [Adhaeretor mobilis]
MKHTALTILTYALVVAFSVATATGAEVRLREFAAPEGSVLLLGDVADIHAATPARRSELATTPLMPSPPTGQQVFLRTAQIRDLLLSRGVDLRGVVFLGASRISIGDAPANIGLDRSERLSPLELRENLQADLTAYLTQQSGYDHWEVQLSLGGDTLQKISRLRGTPSIRGGKAPWIGRQTFELFTGEQSHIVPATVRRNEMALFVVHNIERGMIVGPGDVELRVTQNRLPSNACKSVDAVVGMEARQPLRADTLLSAGQLVAPRLVERGETVTVFARTGGVLVRTLGVAQQHGAQGDLVRVETLDGDDRYAARVTGHRELEVFATGVNAGDLALRNRPATQSKTVIR